MLTKGALGGPFSGSHGARTPTAAGLPPTRGICDISRTQLLFGQRQQPLSKPRASTTGATRFPLTFAAMLAALFFALASPQLSPPDLLVAGAPLVRNLEFVDLDADGLDELVAPSYLSDCILLARRGSGTGFEEFSVASPPLFGVEDVAHGDVDGDGTSDVVAVSRLLGDVVLLPGDGSGGLGPPILLEVLGGMPVRVELVDFLGSGRLDVLVTSPGNSFAPNGGTFLLANRGGGIFDPAVEVFADLLAWHTIARDVDHDGDLDLVTCGRSAEPLSWYRNDGSLPLTAETVVDTTSLQIGSVDWADLDGDGIDDLIGIGRLTSSVTWYQGLPAGGFGPRTTIETGTSLPRRVQPIDLDLDGDLDLATIGESGQQLSIVENLGSGLFGAARFPALPPLTSLRVEALAASDVDLDGFIDLIISRGTDLIWFRNASAAGPLDVEAGRLLTNDARGFADVLAIDVDGDADLDLVTTPHEVDAVRWHELDAHGRFGPARPLVPSDPQRVDRAVAGDFDGDGDDDLIGIDESTGALLWIEQLGSTDFAASTPIGSAPGLIGPIATGDFDGDGDLDLAVADRSFFTPSIGWYENVGGSAVFGPRQTLVALPGQPVALDTGDLDGDGSDDVAVHAEGQTRCWLVRAIGDPAQSITFGPSVFDGTVALDLTDFDADGDLDLVWLRSFNIRLRWSANDGGGTFGATTELVSGSSVPPYSTVGDVDGDGLEDVLIADSCCGSFTWYLNAGGTIGPQQTTTDALALVDRILAADFDLDGDADVVTWSQEQPWLVAYRNEALGPIGVPFCGPAVANSTGLSGRLAARGTTEIDRRLATLVATDLPAHAAAIALASRRHGVTFPVGNSVGRLCLDGTVGRFDRPGEIGSTGPAGSFELEIDPLDLPTSMGSTAATAGERWFFQVWTRDVAMGVATSNFTQGLTIGWR